MRSRFEILTTYAQLLQKDSEHERKRLKKVYDEIDEELKLNEKNK